MPKYHLLIYGCQMNLADADRLRTVLGGLNYQETGKIKEADLIVFVTCAVRQKAEDKIYGHNRNIRKLKEVNPRLKVALTGCMSTYGLEKLKRKMPVLDFVFPITDIDRLEIILNDGSFNSPPPQPSPIKREGDIDSLGYFQIAPTHISPSQMFLPIMTGCNNFCAYCIVPYSRGREASRPHQDILEEAEKFLAQGGKEITLLGQNVNSYKDGEINFTALLKMSNDLPYEYRLHFVTSHPKDMSDELIRCFRDLPKLCEYLHLPVQSGDDEILKRMNRNYTAKHYLGLIEKLRKARPDIAISTDVIVGFPEETSRQFQNTCKLFKQVEFDMAYIAQYSPRPFTAAAALPDNVSAEVKKERWDKLNDILKKTALKKNREYAGREVEVLVENIAGGKAYGRTRSSKQVEFLADGNIKVGDLVNVQITKSLVWGLKGETGYR